MQNSTLFRILATLHKEQFKRLGSFLQSPYHNTNARTLDLYRYIEKFYPDLEDPRLTPQGAFKFLFPNSEASDFSDDRIRRQIHNLKRSVEAFIIAEQLNNDQFIQHRLLADHYYQRAGFDFLEQQIQKFIKSAQRHPSKDAEYHQYLLYLKELIFYHPQNKAHHQLKSSDPLEELTDHLDISYLILKLRYETDLNIRKQTVREEIVTLVPFDQVGSPARNKYGRHLIIRLYLTLLGFQTSDLPPEPEEFAAGLELLEENIPLIGDRESGFMLNVMLNTAIKFQNEGHKAYVSLAADLYVLAEQQNWLLHQNRIQTGVFLNAAFLGSRVGKFEWTKKFIKSYQRHLEKKYRADVTKLSRAAVAYYQSKHAKGRQRHEYLLEALGISLKIKYLGLGFDLRLRALNLRITFDDHVFHQGDAASFQREAKNFEKYLNDHKADMSPGKRRNYLRFVQLTRKLANINTEHHETDRSCADLRKVVDEIEQEDDLALKFWIQEAAEELARLLRC